MRAPWRASAMTALSQGSACRDRAWSLLRGDDLDRLRPFNDDLVAFSISAPHPVAAGLVVGPDDVQDVGVGNERYDAVAPSDSGVGSNVDGGHCKSSRRPSFVAGRAPLGALKSPYMRIRRQHPMQPSDEPSRAARGARAGRQFCQAAPSERLSGVTNPRRRWSFGYE